MTANVLGGVVPLVGREPELDELRRWLGASRAGPRARLGVVEGPSGIGKTRLLDEFAAEVSTGGGTALRGGAHDGGYLAYEPWAEAFRSLLADRSRADIAELVAGVEHQVAAIPWLADLTGEASGHGAGGADLSTVTSAIGAMVRRLVRRGPVVMIVEDVQWADPGSLDLLSELSEQEDLPFLMVAAERRPVATGGRWRQLVERGEVRVDDSLALDELDLNACEGLVTSVCGDSPAIRAAIEPIFEASGGNAFIALQLAHVLDTTAPDAVSVAETVPATAAELWAARLSPLSRDDRRVLTVGAVIGAEFDRGLLATVDGDDAATDAALDVASRAGLVAADLQRPDHYRFVHALVREHLYEAATSLRVTRLHRRIAAALEEGPEVPPPVIFFHASRAGEGQEARLFEQSVLSLHWSLAEGSPANAGEDATHALALLEHPAVREMPEVATLESRLGDGLVRLGRSEGTEILTRVGRAALESGDPRAAAEAVVALLRGDLGAGFGLPKEVARLAFDLGEHVDALDDLTAARVLAGLVIVGDQLPPEFGRAAMSEESLVRARRAADPETLAFVLASYAPAWLEGLDRKLAAMRELIELGQAHDRVDYIVVGYYLMHPLLVEQGRMAEAAEVLDELDRLAAEVEPGLLSALRNPDMASDARAMVVVRRACVALFEGRLDDAEVLIAEVADFAAAPEHATSLLGMTLMYQLGHLADARGTIEQYADYCIAGAADNPDVVLWPVLAAFVLAEGPCPLDAAPFLHRMVDDDLRSLPRDQLSGNSLVMLARVAHRLEDQPAARVVGDRLVEHSGLNTCNGAASQGPCDYGLGLVALTQGDLDEAVRSLDPALDQAQRWGMPVVEARIRVARAAVARSRHDEPLTLAHATEALAISDRLGCSGIADEARALLAP